MWRNWQTRMVQVHVKAISWGFKSLHPHQKEQYPFGCTICPKGWTLPDNALIDPNGTNPPNDKSFYKLMYTYSPNKQPTDYLHFAESGIFSQTFGGYYESRQSAGMSGFSTMDGVKHYTQVAYLGDYFRDAYGTGRSNPFILMYARFLLPNYPYVQIQTSNSNVLTFHGAYARCIAR